LTIKLIFKNLFTMKNAFLLFILFAFTAAVSCSKSKTETAPCTGGATEYKLDEPFFMCFGASVQGQDDTVTLDIEFDEVYGDSRCAYDVDCVWQGRVDIGLTFKYGQDEMKDTLSIGGLSADPKSDSTLFKGYKIKMISVDPYPEYAQVPIPFEEYKIKLVVSSE
jgi:hypothetical protein